MAVPFSNTKLRPPRGFPNLLECLSRQVLREQPKDIYSFAADYFEKLLRQRDESGFDPAKHGAELEDRFYNNKAFKEKPVEDGTNNDEAALKIQTKYRQHVAKRQVDSIRKDHAATSIQAGIRGYLARKHYTQPEPMSLRPQVLEKTDEKAASETAIMKTAGLPEAEAKRRQQAATIIQRQYRFYKSKSNRMGQDKAGNHQKPCDTHQEEIDIDLEDPEVEAAATKIQGAFRGMQGRKSMKASESNSDKQPAAASPPAAPAENEEEIDIDLNDPEVGKAATKIQGAFRNKFGSRSKPNSASDVAESSPRQSSPATAKLNTPPSPQKAEAIAPATAEEEEEIDIDLEDPDVEKAAFKIQGAFRGMQGRKTKANTTKAEPVKNEEEKQPKVSRDEAATKIQAGIRGYLTRKHFNETDSTNEPTNV